MWFDSPADLIEKCTYFLEHDDERKKIAALGHEIAANEFAYEVLLPKVLNL